MFNFMRGVTYKDDTECTEDAKSNIDLLAIFEAFLNRTKLEVRTSNLKAIIEHDLKINITEYDAAFLNILIEALGHYIIAWPGWKRKSEYDKGILIITEWFKRFKEYLIFKCNFIIINVLQNNAPLLDTSKVTCASTQTALLNDRALKKPFSSYCLCVQAPPAILNNVAFLESDGDIIIRQFTVKPWVPLNLKQFLNWPYVSVELKLPDISLSRSNIHNIKRYLSAGNVFPVFDQIKPIFYMKRTHSDVKDEDMISYTHDFMEYYVKQLLDVFKTIQIPLERLIELQTIFIEFLNDIRVANVYDATVCTNTSVGFHIGKCKYVRNKKILPKPDVILKDSSMVKYYEMITPRMDYTLNEFTAKQDLNDRLNVTFKSLTQILQAYNANNTCEEIQELKYHVNNTCIIYNCTMCKTSVSGANAYFNLTKHFEEYHKTEQPVLCCKCFKEIDCTVLALNRWSHSCSST